MDVCAIKLLLFKITKQQEVLKKLEDELKCKQVEMESLDSEVKCCAQETEQETKV